MSTKEKQIERDAKSLFEDGVLSFQTGLINACIESGLMKWADVSHYPCPEDWTIEQCKSWCEEYDLDYRDVSAEHRSVLECWLSNVVTFSVETIDTAVLRQMLMNVIADSGDVGLAYWRQAVTIESPIIYAWYCVTEWLADDLVRIEEYVLRNEFGDWWGRQCGGQDVLMDGVFQAIARNHPN